MLAWHNKYSSHSNVFISSIMVKHSMHIYIFNLRSFEVVFSFLHKSSNFFFFKLLFCKLAFAITLNGQRVV